MGVCVCVCVCVLQPSIKGVSKQAGLGEFPLVLFWEFGRLGEEHGARTTTKAHTCCVWILSALYSSWVMFARDSNGSS